VQQFTFWLNGALADTGARNLRDCKGDSRQIPCDTYVAARNEQMINKIRAGSPRPGSTSAGSSQFPPPPPRLAARTGRSSEGWRC